jgi:WD40 repeat protein
VNHFKLVDITKAQTDVLRSFLDCIGIVNAASLSHLCINFPTVVSIDEEAGKVRLREDSLQSFNLLQEKCTKLSTIETVVHFKNSEILTKTDQFLQEAFAQIDTQLKVIHSLQRDKLVKARGTLQGHWHFVKTVVFSPDGQLIASGSNDRTARLWNIGTGELRRNLQGHSHWVNIVVFSPNGQLIASGSKYRTVRLWDVVTGES